MSERPAARSVTPPALTLVYGAGSAFAYQQAFLRLGLWPNALTGALLGGIQALASVAMLASPWKHSRSGRAGASLPHWRVPATAGIPALLLGHVVYGAAVGWAIGREPRRERYVSPAFLRWLRRQEEADNVERQPVPLQPRLRALPPVPAPENRVATTPAWTLPRAA